MGDYLGARAGSAVANGGLQPLWDTSGDCNMALFFFGYCPCRGPSRPGSQAPSGCLKQDAEKIRRAWPCATGACMLLICNGGAGSCPTNIEVRQTLSSSC